jgi:hypothetical protein
MTFANTLAAPHHMANLKSAKITRVKNSDRTSDAIHDSKPRLKIRHRDEIRINGQDPTVNQVSGQDTL